MLLLMYLVVDGFDEEDEDWSSITQGSSCANR